jgi:hypothetical protein
VSTVNVDENPRQRAQVSSICRCRRPMAQWICLLVRGFSGGRWYTFDPRNNMPRIGRVLIALGRDAADVPITHTFGPNTLVSFKVWTDEVS